MRSALRLALLGVLLGALGCAPRPTVSVQRATEGPAAEEVYRARFAQGYGRLPTFDESSAWRDDLDRRVGDYLVKHPEVATSPRASQFRFQRRVTLGMTREEVTLLVGTPDATTTEQDVMKLAAEHFWPEIGRRAREMWIYPPGWQLYFDGERLVDVTARGRAPIE